MMLKASTFCDAQTLDLISKSKTPREAKKLGRKVKGFDESKWNADTYGFDYSTLKIVHEPDFVKCPL